MKKLTKKEQAATERLKELIDPFDQQYCNSVFERAEKQLAAEGAQFPMKAGTITQFCDRIAGLAVLDAVRMVSAAERMKVLLCLRLKKRARRR